MVEGLSEKPDFTFVYETPHYGISRNSVVQENYVAYAKSGTQIVSNYESLTHKFLSPQIFFKFGINGNDNEMGYGQNHFIYCLSKGDTCETPLLKFGEQFTDDRPIPDNVFLEPNTLFKIRLDLREVLAAFKTDGYYLTKTGDKINAAEFIGVYVAGSAAPLTWNFPELVNHPELILHDETGEGIYEITLLLNPHRQDGNMPWAEWTLKQDISRYPNYQSDYTLLDALYNLSLEELELAIEKDNTFRTGKDWAGVWTRDISYSIILALAAVHPAISQHSLLQKVKNGRIIQDTGTGGAYPVSTDRQIWAVAAWEIYLVTGNEDWLRQAYKIIQASLEDDYQQVYDAQTGLVRGESSFLDWRIQTYPAWMQPADIYESECLGTNAIHYQANTVLALMAHQLQDTSAYLKYNQLAADIKAGLNKYMWQSHKGYYGQYLYGRKYKILSPRAEALGEALCVLFDIADARQQQEIIAQTPVGYYGIPCINPQIPKVPPYHNKAVWPFVQAYWSWATAKAGNQAALTESISTLFRATALFLTNKENFVSATGDYGGTQKSSDNMLWSLAGNLNITYKIFFGLQFTPDGLIFKPFVPQAYAGKHHLKNFKYRQAVLDIFLEGAGNIIKKITLNGRKLSEAKLPAHLNGYQEIRIVLADKPPLAGKINKVAEYVSPDTPVVAYSEAKISWLPVDQAVVYKIIENGKILGTTSETSFNIISHQYGQYQVISVDALGTESFASEPVEVAIKNCRIYKMGCVNAQGYVQISKQVNTALKALVAVPETGIYAIDVKYANGHGPIETEDKCALRTLFKGNTPIGTLVMPQRGSQAWTDWGYSNAIITPLEKGNVLFTLAFLPSTQNMNGEINEAWIDHIRFMQIN